MWNKAPAKVKCPRGDCEYRDRKADEVPCSVCTCNQRSNSICRHFAYQPKGASYDRDRTKPSVLGKSPKE